MKVIIAGGRNYSDYYAVCLTIEETGWNITEIVSGGAPGADALGERWAKEASIPIQRFPADWKRHGKKAGPIRNAEMADYADALITMPGGRGTADMIRQMRERGKPVHRHR